MATYHDSSGIYSLDANKYASDDTDREIESYLESWLDRAALDRARAEVGADRRRPPEGLAADELAAWWAQRAGRLEARVSLLVSRLERRLE